MTKNYGIKVSRPGYDVKTAQPNQLAFSSKYKTLKVHTSGSGSLTDGSRIVTIAHGLGYVPFFMVHTTMSSGFGSSLFSSGDYVLAPAGLSGVLADPTIGVNDDLLAYADATNLYIRAQDNFGKIIETISNSSNLDECMAWEYTGFGGGTSTGAWYVGFFSPLNNEYGAVRFGNIQIGQGETIYNATLNLPIHARSGSGEVKMTVWGINEDNTANFNSGSAATSRSKTTASVNSNSTLTNGNILGINVTNLVQEIVNRGGWSSGNALGIMFWDNGTSGDNDYGSGTGDATLTIVKSNTIASYKYTIFLNQLE